MFYFNSSFYCMILCSGPNGNLVMFSAPPSLLITMMSCSLTMIMASQPTVQCVTCILRPPGSPQGLWSWAPWRSPSRASPPCLCPLAAPDLPPARNNDSAHRSCDHSRMTWNQYKKHAHAHWEKYFFSLHLYLRRPRLANRSLSSAAISLHLAPGLISSSPRLWTWTLASHNWAATRLPSERV